MLICGIAFSISIIILWIGIRKKRQSWKKTGGIVCIAALLGLAAGCAEEAAPLLDEEGYLIRPENGEGDMEAELVLDIDGIVEQEPFEVQVPEQHLTADEEQECLNAAIGEIEEAFPGNNPSVNHICSKVVISDTYQDGKVKAEWNFSNYRLIDTEGNILTEELEEEGEIIQAVVTLSCEDSELEYEFYFSVYAPEKSRKEELLDEISEQIEKSGQAEGEDGLKLPEEAGGYRLRWSEKASKTPEELLAVGIVLAFFVPIAGESRKRERQKKREELLLMEYPDMVSKLTLLLGAGMTLSGAWNRIVEMYTAAREHNTVPKQPVYEEMLITCREIESGVGEVKAYERFGTRCGIQKYRKLGSLLSQNLKKGSQSLTALLEAEAGDVFAERKSLARKYGEEAGTKLLLPMMIMFGIVIFILMVPAVISFQM